MRRLFLRIYRVFTSCPFALAACSSPGDAPEALIRFDSAGVEVVENMRVSEHPRIVCVGRRPLTEIGAVEGRPGHDLYRAWTATRLSDGRIAVGNSGSGEVRYFAADGTFLSSFGRRGRGPGEFQAITVLKVLHGDSLFVYDRWSQGITILNPEGTPAQHLTLQDFRYPGRLEWAVPSVGGGYWAGSHLSYLETDPRASEPGLHRNTTVLLRYSEQGLLVDTVAMVPGAESYMPREGDGAMSVQPLFGKDAFIASGPSGVFLGSNDELEIMEFSSLGDLRRIIRYPSASRPLQESEVTEASGELVRRAQSRPLPYPVDVFFRADALPTLRPSFEDLLVDSRGALWVGPYRRTRSAENAWWVFAADGTLEGAVRLPHRLELLEVGEDYVLGRTEDDLGVEFIRVYPLFTGTDRPDACF